MFSELLLVMDYFLHFCVLTDIKGMSASSTQR